MRLQLARLQGGLIHGLQCRPDLGYEMNDIKRLKIPYDISSKYALLKNQVLEESSFLHCHLLTSLHWSLVSTFVFMLIHLESYL